MRNRAYPIEINGLDTPYPLRLPIYPDRGGHPANWTLPSFYPNPPSNSVQLTVFCPFQPLCGVILGCDIMSMAEILAKRHELFGARHDEGGVQEEVE